MTNSAQVNQTQKIERFLTRRGFRRGEPSPFGELCYLKGRDEWLVEITPDSGYWAIRKFTDSDIDGVAVGRFVTESEGETLEELQVELVSLCVLPWECPLCGAEGGTPYSVRSREYQGDSPHGGFVNLIDEGCTKCLRPRWSAEDEAELRGDMEREERRG